MPRRRSVVFLALACASAVGCINQTTTVLEPRGEPLDRRFVRPASGPGVISARLRPSALGTRMRLFEGSPCEEWSEVRRSTIAHHTREISTGGWIWVGGLALGGAVTMTAAERKEDGANGIGALMAAAVLLTVAAARRGTYDEPGPVTVDFRRVGPATCPGGPARGESVVVDVGGLVFDGVTDANGIVDVPLKIGEVPWAIRVRGAPVVDVKSE